MSKSDKPPKVVSESFVWQINILKSLADSATPAPSSKQLMINEIAERVGLRDEKEVQRYLYILEGQKLVSPYPAGDFTSRMWHITKDGINTLRHISQNSIN